jgi:hypothetical protein
MSIDVNRERAIDLAVSQIEKQFGKGAIMKLGEEALAGHPALPTGSLGLDIALGIGGMPRGRVVEIYGPESSGKTTLALQLVAEGRSAAASAPSSTPSTRSTSATRRSSASTSRSCSSRSPTTASRRSRSPTRSCARARSTCS